MRFARLDTDAADEFRAAKIASGTFYIRQIVPTATGLLPSVLAPNSDLATIEPGSRSDEPVKRFVERMLAGLAIGAALAAVIRRTPQTVTESGSGEWADGHTLPSTAVPTAGMERWRFMLKELTSRFREHHTGIVSGSLAYYAFLSLFPSLIAAVAIYGLATDLADLEAQITFIADKLPPEGDGADHHPTPRHRSWGPSRSRSDGRGFDCVGVVVCLRGYPGADLGSQSCSWPAGDPQLRSVTRHGACHHVGRCPLCRC